MVLNPRTGKRMRNKSTGRNYKREYASYQGKPENIKKRTARDAARRTMQKNGVVKKGSGKDVHHVNANPYDNRPHNLRVVNRSANRSFKRTRTGKMRRV
tara:strand:- start:245 stop:541 length:297 start_codon:yes stop_codon:yes gene_type:complete